MRKLTAIVVASTLAMGAMNLAHAADSTTAASTTEKPMMHHHKGKGPHGMMHPGMMMMQGVNLTDAQKQQIRDIMKDQRSKMQRPSVEERRAMHDVVASDSFDRTKAESLIDQGAAANKARMVAHLEAQNKIYNVLTADQKKQYNANFEKHLTDAPKHQGKMLQDAE
ncbi:ATP-independent periplasmic protein-refolding chaperone [Salmonella enterica subsp. enterica serovar Choleraesuis]|nr:ATP-independent periplasmic protein-refolding chaperone [Salmonella enterica subsp. enterica serovar Choleraesuis]